MFISPSRAIHFNISSIFTRNSHVFRLFVELVSKPISFIRQMLKYFVNHYLNYKIAFKKSMFQLLLFGKSKIN